MSSEAEEIEMIKECNAQHDLRKGQAPPRVLIDQTGKWPFKRVLNSHVIVMIDKFKYSGRLAIPENAQHSPTKGRVIGVAADITDIEVGDKLLYSQFAGYLLKFEELPLLRCIGYTEILSVLNEDSPELISEGS